MKISIRHAKIKDLDAMIELAKCASREGEYKGFEELSYEKQKDLISFVMDNSYVFVVELSGEVREPGKEPYFLKDEIIGTTSLKEFDSLTFTIVKQKSVGSGVRRVRVELVEG